VVVPSRKVTVSPLGGKPEPGEVTLTVAVKVTGLPEAAGLIESLRAVVVTAWPTVSVAVPLLVVKLVSPPYEAVIVSLPTDRVVVLNVATPPLSVPVPSVVLPSVKVTVPVGVPAPGELALTVAVTVSDWPETAEAGEMPTAVVLAAWLTVSVAVPLLVVKSVSPP
jgi:hypothetical protein